MMDRVSLVVPTLNEGENIDPLLEAVFEHARHTSLDVEVIVVDDGSTDSTRERVEAWARGHPVRLLAREGEKGLSGAVLAGAAAASRDVVVVMDADLSHPVDKIAELARPVLEGTADMAVGSRYIPGGSIPEWPLVRRILSRGAVLLASLVTDVRDPVSGFFAVDKRLLLENGKSASGFKIGLEVLARRGEDLRVEEVPITFVDRTRGESKLGLGVIGAYVRQLVALAGGRVSGASAARFSLVGLMGFVVDLLVFNGLLATGAGLGPAHVTSFFAATVFNFFLNSRWAFAEKTRSPGPLTTWRGYGAFVLVALLALFLRGGVLAVLAQRWGWSPRAAIVPAILVAAVVNYLGCAFYVFSPPRETRGRGVGWRTAAVGIVAYTLALRLLFLGQIDLIPQEAYYWNYSQHLDIGYLDHPPMVAWLIWLVTAVFGQTEFAVRLSALFSWLLALLFTFLFTRNLLGKPAAIRAALLLAVLPFFFFSSSLMTPDAPLVACWAGILYFLERALIGEKPRAWWGVGACLGVGMLSKYTIALVGLAALAYIILDPRSRRWLRRFEPYAACLLAALLFSPVIFWNAEHHWASFVFQGPRRWTHAMKFNLPELFCFVLLLLSPVGLLAAFQGMFGKPAKSPALAHSSRRKRLFVQVLTLLPLSVFVAFSLFQQTKLNWTGPLWLAAVPFLATTLGPAATPAPGRSLARIVERAWGPTIIVLLLFYGAALHTLVLGLPGFDMPRSKFLVDWKNLGQAVGKIEEKVVETTGQDPLIIGLNKYNLSSELAFYNPFGNGSQKTAGVHLFGSRGLMYERWFPKSRQKGKSIILVSEKRDRLELPAVVRCFKRCGPIERIPVAGGRLSIDHYYRIGYDYAPMRGRLSSNARVSRRDAMPHAGLARASGPADRRLRPAR